MAWVDMRCPKCGEILPDFVDSCYTCEYKFIAKEYDPQTYPDTRKRDKELWKYKYDTMNYPNREFGYAFDYKLIDWSDIVLMNNIKDIYDDEGKIKENLTFEEELKHYNIARPTKPSGLPENYEKYVNRLKYKAEYFENLAFIFFFVPAIISFILVYCCRDWPLILDLTPLCLMFLFPVMIEAGKSSREELDRLLPRLKQYEEAEMDFTAYAKKEITRFKRMEEFQNMVKRKCQKSRSGEIISGDPEMVCIFNKGEYNQCEYNLTSFYARIMENKVDSAQMNQVIQELSQMTGILPRELKKFIYETKITGMFPEKYQGKTIEEEKEEREAIAIARAESRIVRCPKCGCQDIGVLNRGYDPFWGWVGSGEVVDVCKKCGYKWKP